MSSSIRARWIGVAIVLWSICATTSVVRAGDTFPSYPVKSSAVELLTNSKSFRPLAQQMQGDIEQLLASQPDNSGLRQRLLRSLVSLLLLEGYRADPARQAQLVGRANELTVDDLSGLLLRTYVSTLQAQGWPRPNSVPLRSHFERNLLEALQRDGPSKRLSQAQGLLAKLPQWDKQVLQGIAQATLQPAIDANQALSAELALQLVELRFITDVLTPLRPAVQSTLRAFESRHAVTENFWAGRALTFTDGRDCQPVVVAVWDSGVDTSVFPGQLYINQAERLDGADNDGNGFIDDVNGIAFDVSGAPTSQLLQQSSEVKLDNTTTMRLMQGMLDVQAALDTPAAREIVTTMRALPPDQAKTFRQELGLISNYLHGTWVASITADSNRCARLLIARTEFEYRLPPAPWGRQWADQMSENIQRAVKYFSTQGVRVVNMSWRLSRREIEKNLESTGQKLAAAERASVANDTFGKVRDALFTSMRSASDILFVVSAGNSDAEFADVIPASFDLPNILTVGAVDQFGQRAPFSNVGRAVDVYAPGIAVAGLAPGGQKVSWSGTSAAAPAVTNLASKLLALDPSLTPAALSKLIVEQALAESGDAPEIIHPKRTAEHLLQGLPRHAEAAAH